MPGTVRYFVAGGAGFIGSHLTRRLSALANHHVTIFDNFSSGRVEHLMEAANRDNIRIIKGDLKDLPALTEGMRGCDHVFHFASNPDIAKAMKQPDVDFWEGSYLTQNVIEAMRISGVGKLSYASGSGVYGDTGDKPVFEDYSPLQPVSPYGASKLAGEAMIGAYCHMFDLRAVAFRFANVVGPNQTHGVTYDFVRRLIEQPRSLRILGDGSQSKAYIHVADVLDAMLLASPGKFAPFEVYNVATEDYVTVKEIADLVVKRLGLKDVAYDFTGGKRGWKGDVPVVRFDTRRIRGRGWANRRTSVEALTDAIDTEIVRARGGRS